MNANLPKETKALIQIAEMYRIYWTVEHMLLNTSPACLAITSATQKEGKSAMVVGLATMAAMKDKKRVLAIDLNWHNPSLHSYFNLKLTPREYLLNGKHTEDNAQKSGVDNLDILTAAAMENPEDENIGNDLTDKLLNDARRSYDLIVVDTSRLFPVNRYMIDPLTVSRVADGVALVVLANSTSRQQVKRAKTALETAGANILGLVMNQWKNPLALA